MPNMIIESMGDGHLMPETQHRFTRSKEPSLNSRLFYTWADQVLHVFNRVHPKKGAFKWYPTKLPILLLHMKLLDLLPSRNSADILTEETAKFPWNKPCLSDFALGLEESLSMRNSRDSLKTAASVPILDDFSIPKILIHPKSFSS